MSIKSKKETIFHLFMQDVGKWPGVLQGVIIYSMMKTVYERSTINFERAKFKANWRGIDENTG